MDDGSGRRGHMSNRARGSGAGEHRQGVTLTGLARADIDIADSIHGVGLGSDQTASHLSLIHI